MSARFSLNQRNTGGHRPELSKMIFAVAHPIPAAERRQSLATAGGRGLCAETCEPRKGRKNLSPLRGSFGANYNHGLWPWLDSASAPRLNKDATAPRFFFGTTKLCLTGLVIDRPYSKERKR
jgi:hypothetical protein